MSAWAAGIFTLIGASVVALIALAVAWSSRPEQPKEGVVARVYRVRRVYFVLLAVTLLTGLVLTLPKVPYPIGVATPDARVAVTGWMWTWRFDRITGDGIHAEATSLTVPVGKTIEFDVTSGDVNHGFGIYDDAGHLLTQTQAMPGYTNRLRYRFTKAGVYHVLCMEYCGFGHHLMTTTIHAE
jgi:cytochrome c oxidase subunit II